jgi:hypothetical protein
MCPEHISTVTLAGFVDLPLYPLIYLKKKRSNCLTYRRTYMMVSLQCFIKWKYISHQILLLRIFRFPHYAFCLESWTSIGQTHSLAASACHVGGLDSWQKYLSWSQTPGTSLESSTLQSKVWWLTLSGPRRRPPTAPWTPRSNEKGRYN